jgi:hypothetical protein
MATDYEVTDKLRLLNAQKTQLEAQLTELDDLYNRLDATSEQAKNDEESNSIFQQKLAISEKITNIQKNVDAVSNQIADLNNRANTQATPATQAEKDNAAVNTASESQNTTTTGTGFTSVTLLSSDEQKKQTDSLYPTDPNATEPDPTAIKKSTEDAAKTEKPAAEITSIDKKQKAEPIPNPLHEYPSYTYGISLHALTTKDFNDLSTNGPKKFKISKTLISSASRYHDTRIPSFRDDFYFEDLKMETIVGMNSHAQGTNAIQLSFSLIEPYGLTLLNRLIDVNISEFEATSYLEIPYLLEINFFAYDDQGNIADLKDHTKFIPIKLVDMKIKASVKGGEYEISAVPFSHSALSETTNASPANFEVVAQTVRGFFNSQTLAINELKQINDSVPKSPNSGSNGTNTAGSDVRQADTANKSNNETGAATTPPAISITSYVAAYNAWQIQAAKNGVQQYADEIKVIVDDAMQTNIVFPRKNPSDKAPIKDKLSASKREASNNVATQSSTPVTGPDFERSTFNVNAGTSILALINQVLLNSEYITKQIIDPTVQQDINSLTSDGSPAALAAKLKKETFKWYKIIPQVILGPYDTVRNQYQRSIVYHVKTFEYHNSKDNRAVQSFPDGYAKKYDYMFTGQNNDIIDFEIDFNSLYYTAAQSDLAKNEQISKQQDSGASANSKSTVGSNPSSGVTKISNIPVAGQAGAGTLGAGTDSTKVQARLVSQSILSGAKGDMLNLKLKILGDPQFIKQDDVFINPGHPDYDDTKVLSTTTNSLVMDSGEIYCYVTFKTPVDIDETTGLLRKDSKYVESVFSGYFRVMTVQSEFQNGKFVQTIDLIRQFNQPGDDKSSDSNQLGDKNAADNRITDKNLVNGNKAADPKVNSTASGNPDTVVVDKKTTSTNESNAAGTVVSRKETSSTTTAMVSGGGVTLRKADGTTQYLPDDPNERQKAISQETKDLNALADEANDQVNVDKELAQIVNSGPPRENQDF